MRGTISCLFAVCVVLHTHFLLADKKTPSNPDLRTVIEAETNGDLDLRKQLLDEVVRKTPDDNAAHWLLGQVQSGKDWKPIENILAAAKPKKILTDYWALRAKSQPTLESQTELAAFCRKHSLKPQERVHLTAIVELDPDNESARKRLGYERMDGRWQLPQEIRAAQQAAADAGLALRRHRVEILAIRDGLAAGKLGRDEAVEQLLAMDEPGVIAAWEALLSPTALGAAAVVEALKQISTKEATQSLARHALFSPIASASAKLELLNRDEQAFIPMLLAELHSPWLATSQLMQTPDGRLLCRHSLYADGQDKQQLAVFDQAFFLTGNRFMAAANATGQAAIATNLTEVQRAAENAHIESNNARIMKLLQELTQENEADSPQAWWAWWNDRNEVHFSGAKPLQQSYAYTSTQVVGQPLLPLASSGSQRITERTGKDCLAGGTPIVTEMGPVAVDRIRMGDLVLAQDERTGELAFKPVLRTTIRAPENLIHIKLSDDTIRASGGHPFWVSGKGWTRARELKAGMVLHAAVSPSVIEDVTTEEEPVRTFNLVVADYHSYFVGNGRVLSHDNTIRGNAEQLLPGFEK